MVNLIKHFKIIIYDSRIVLTKNHERKVAIDVQHNLFLACHKHNSLPRGPIQPSSPSIKELHSLSRLFLAYQKHNSLLRGSIQPLSTTTKELHSLTPSFLAGHKHNSLPRGPLQPSSPSTKELHSQSLLDRTGQEDWNVK